MIKIKSFLALSLLISSVPFCGSSQAIQCLPQEGETPTTIIEDSSQDINIMKKLKLQMEKRRQDDRFRLRFHAQNLSEYSPFPPQQSPFKHDSVKHVDSEVVQVIQKDSPLIHKNHLKSVPQIIGESFAYGVLDGVVSEVTTLVENGLYNAIVLGNEQLFRLVFQEIGKLAGPQVSDIVIDQLVGLGINIVFGPVKAPGLTIKCTNWLLILDGVLGKAIEHQIEIRIPQLKKILKDKITDPTSTIFGQYAGLGTKTVLTGLANYYGSGENGTKNDQLVETLISHIGNAAEKGIESESQKYLESLTHQIITDSEKYARTVINESLQTCDFYKDWELYFQFLFRDIKAKQEQKLIFDVAVWANMPVYHMLDSSKKLISTAIKKNQPNWLRQAFKSLTGNISAALGKRLGNYYGHEFAEKYVKGLGNYVKDALYSNSFVTSMKSSAEMKDEEYRILLKAEIDLRDHLEAEEKARQENEQKIHHLIAEEELKACSLSESELTDLEISYFYQMKEQNRLEQLKKEEQAHLQALKEETQRQKEQEQQMPWGKWLALKASRAAYSVISTPVVIAQGAYSLTWQGATLGYNGLASMGNGAYNASTYIVEGACAVANKVNQSAANTADEMKKKIRQGIDNAYFYMPPQVVKQAGYSLSRTMTLTFVNAVIDMKSQEIGISPNKIKEMISKKVEKQNLYYHGNLIHRTMEIGVAVSLDLSALSEYLFTDQFYNDVQEFVDNREWY